jgi:predicted nucleotidyltransferase
VEKLLLKVVSGSQAYNLATPESDVDYRGIYLDGPEMIFGLGKSETKYLDTKDDVVYGFKHFMSLLCKGNPNILELLYLKPEHYLILDPRFKRHIIAHRHKFLTKHACQSYRGYVAHQMKLVEKDGRPAYSHNFMDCKSAMHVIRLLYQLRNIVVGLSIYVSMDEKDRHFLLDVKNGKAFKDYEGFYLFVEKLQDSLKDLEQVSHIPERVDKDWVNMLMKKFFEECFYEEPNAHR